jgi:hypothetical protein
MADALVSLLNGYGYQPVFLPRTSVEPPELYNFADHRLIRRGPLARYFTEAPKFPVTSGRLGDIQGNVTSGKTLDTAVGFLKNALAALGIGAIVKMDLSFAGSNGFVFGFSDVTYVTVEPADLDRVIQSVQMPLAVPDAYVENGALHVAYEYAYARTLVMRRDDGRAFSANLSGGVGEWVDIGAKAKAEVNNNSEITFTSTAGDAAAFAYKAGRLQKVGDRWIFEPEIVMRRVVEGGAEVRRKYLPAERVVLIAEDGSP